jgi:hypothetical protein
VGGENIPSVIKKMKRNTPESGAKSWVTKVVDQIGARDYGEVTVKIYKLSYRSGSSMIF